MNSPKKNIVRPEPQPSSIDVANSPQQIMTKRLEIMLRKEKKKEEEEAQLTFQPKLQDLKSTARGRDSNVKEGTNSSIGNRFDLLYNDALKRHLDTTKVSDSKELTFKPNTSLSARGRSRFREKNADSSDNGDVVNRLYSSNTHHISEETVKATTLPFKPKISKRAKSLERSADKAIEERLISIGTTATQRKELQKRESDLKALRDCTFTPKTNSKRSRSMSADSRKSMSSVNQINEITSVDDVTERMKLHHEAKQKKLQEAIKLKQQKEAATITLKPDLSLTKKVAEQLLGDDLDSISVYERLAHQKKKDTSELAMALEAKDTFHPHLVANRAHSPNGRMSLTSEAGGSVHERLFKEAAELKIQADLERKIRDEREKIELTFAPKIKKTNPILGGGDPATPVFERLSMDNKSNLHELLAKLKLEQDMKDCTFKPTLMEPMKNSAAAAVLSNRQSDEPSFVRLNKLAQQMKLDYQKREQDKLDDELKGVTFTPELNPVSLVLASKKKQAKAIDEKSETIVQASTRSQESKVRKPNVSMGSSGLENVLSKTIRLKSTLPIEKPNQSILAQDNGKETSEVTLSPKKPIIKKSELLTGPPPSTTSSVILSRRSKTPDSLSIAQRMQNLKKKVHSSIESASVNSDIDISNSTKKIVLNSASFISPTTSSTAKSMNSTSSLLRRNSDSFMKPDNEGVKESPSLKVTSSSASLLARTSSSAAKVITASTLKKNDSLKIMKALSGSNNRLSMHSIDEGTALESSLNNKMVDEKNSNPLTKKLSTTKFEVGAKKTAIFNGSDDLFTRLSTKLLVSKGPGGYSSHDFKAKLNEGMNETNKKEVLSPKVNAKEKDVVIVQQIDENNLDDLFSSEATEDQKEII